MTLIYVVASFREPVLGRLEELLAGVPGVELQLGDVRSVAQRCDAELMKFYLAHDRYGGTPEIGRAQVLENRRQDGAAPLIVATPPFAPGPEVTEPAALRARLRTVFLTSLRELNHDERVSGNEEFRVLIHVEGLGLDEFAVDLVAAGLRDALAQIDAPSAG